MSCIYIKQKLIQLIKTDMPHRPKNKTRPWVIPRDKKKVGQKTSGRNTHGDMHWFYNNRRWKAHRLYYIQRNPLCEECQRVGRTTAGVVVDHITPMRQGGDPYNEKNLQTMCSKCHDKKSRKEATTIVYTPTTMYK